MLSAHSRLACGPETGFFASLASQSISALTSRDDWPSAALGFLAGLRLGGEPVISRYGLTEAELEEFLQQQRPSVSSMLASLTEQFMRREDKQRWVEKSPVHLLYLEQIRALFPDSPIVRIVRDPRDVALSLAKVPWGPSSWAGALLYWRRFMDASGSFFAGDRRSCSIRFEDLVEDPERILTELCGFLDEPFESGMLDFQRSADNVRRVNEEWKTKVSQPLDRERASAWRGRVTDEQVSLAFSVVGDYLSAHGYDSAVEDEGRFRYVRLHPLNEHFETLFDLQALSGEGLRFWARSADERPAATLLVGHPEAQQWLGPDRQRRLSSTWSLGRAALAARVSSSPLIWIRGQEASRYGVCASMIRLCLLGCGTRDREEATQRLLGAIGREALPGDAS